MSGHTPWAQIKRQREQASAFKHALRLVGRQVRLVEEARCLELDPARRAEANAMFELAALLRAERLRVLEQAGLIEAPIR